MKTKTISTKVIVLFALFFALISTLLNGQISTISINEFEKGILKNEIQILDVRTAEEYQTGHLKNALQADWNKKTEFKDRIKSLDKTKPIFIYCLSGSRSNDAMEWLYKNDFKVVYNMKGGINAWKQSGKKVQGAVAIKQITAQEFLSTIPIDKTVLVDVGAEWCPPCKKMKPIIDSLENEMYTIIKVDGGTQTQLCKELKITSFPMFLVYKSGKEVLRKQGVFTKDELKFFLK